MYCSIIRDECHSVARILKRDYNAFLSFGAWRSPVAHLHGVQGVGGSNPLAPTERLSKESLLFFKGIRLTFVGGEKIAFFFVKEI